MKMLRYRLVQVIVWYIFNEEAYPVVYLTTNYY